MSTEGKAATDEDDALAGIADDPEVQKLLARYEGEKRQKPAIAPAGRAAGALTIHEPATKDNDIEGALPAVKELQGRRDQGDNLQAEAVAEEMPQPIKPDQGAGQAPVVARGDNKPFSAAIAAQGLEVEVREWIARQRKAKSLPGHMIAMAHRKGGAFEVEVRRQLGPAVKAKTFRGIVAKHKRQLRQDLKDAGIAPVAIRRKDERMRGAIAELVRQRDAGQRASAVAAARRQGLDPAQAKKLAYKTRVTREAASAGIYLFPDSPFVLRLRQDPDLLDIVIAPHETLSALAAVMEKAQRSLANRPDAPSAGRGRWHARAVKLREAGSTLNEIARLTGQKADTVKKMLTRRGVLGNRDAGSGGGLAD